MPFPSIEFKEKLRKMLNSKKITVVGIGNVMQGDDAIGVVVAQRIKEKKGNFHVIIAESTPENVIGPVVRSNPELVLFIDAADFGAVIGTVAVFDPTTVEDEAYLGGSHALPLSMFALAIKQEIPAVDIIIIGIQIDKTFFDAKMSTSVEETADWLVEFLMGVG